MTQRPQYFAPCVVLQSPRSASTAPQSPPLISVLTVRRTVSGTISIIWYWFFPAVECVNLSVSQCTIQLTRLLNSTFSFSLRRSPAFVELLDRKGSAVV